MADNIHVQDTLEERNEKAAAASKKAKLGHHALSAMEASELAKSALSKVLGKKAYLISGISETPDGEWAAEIEVVEEEHMISNFDVIGTYVATLDSQGNLKSWSRKALRKRD